MAIFDLRVCDAFNLTGMGRARRQIKRQKSEIKNTKAKS